MGILTEKDCEDILKNVPKCSGKNVTVKSMNVAPLSDTTSGFIGNHLKLILNVEINDSQGKSMETIKAFIKSMPQTPSHAKYAKAIKAFHKEHQNFNKLLPFLLDLSKQYNHPWGPRCFLTKTNLLVFEDLTESGFTMLDRNLLDLDHLKIAFETLAYFHSASVIFEDIYYKNNRVRRNLSELFPECVSENAYAGKQNPVRYKWYLSSIKSVISIIKTMKHYTEEQLIIIETRLLKFKDDVADCFRTSKDRLNVFSHGDMWMNNLMFRYEEGIPVECRLVDFQFTRYAPGSLDLVTLLYTSVDRDTRNRYENEIINIYEQAFKRQLMEANVTVPDYNVKDDVNHFRAAGCLEGILFEMVTKLDQEANMKILHEEAEQFFLKDKSALIMEVFERDDYYRARLSTLITEFIDNFILNDSENNIGTKIL